jgi:hypothetical protein
VVGLGCAWYGRCNGRPFCGWFLLFMGMVVMTDFMQKQFDISQELIRLMNREHEQRSRMLEMYEEKLAEKDRQIAKLRSTIEALEVLVNR